MLPPSFFPANLPWGSLVVAAARAAAAVARFDQSLQDAAPPVPELWLAQASLREAAAGARLDGCRIDEERLALLEASGNPGPVGSGDRWALVLLATQRHLQQLPAEAVLTPAGLAGLWAGLGRRVPDDAEAGTGALAFWLQHWHILATLPGLPAVPAVGLGLALWHQQAPAGAETLCLGRLLPALLARDCGCTHRPWLMLSTVAGGGSVPDAQASRSPGPWLCLFLDHVARAAEDAAGRLATLRGRRERWLQRLGPRRTGSRLAAAVDVALAAPVLSRKLLTDRLSLSPRGASLLLAELCALGLIREVSGRARFRFFRPAG